MKLQLFGLGIPRHWNRRVVVVEMLDVTAAPEVTVAPHYSNKSILATKLLQPHLGQCMSLVRGDICRRAQERKVQTRFHHKQWDKVLIGKSFCPWKIASDASLAFVQWIQFSKKHVKTLLLSSDFIPSNPFMSLTLSKHNRQISLGFYSKKRTWFIMIQTKASYLAPGKQCPHQPFEKWKEHHLVIMKTQSHLKKTSACLSLGFQLEICFSPRD